MSTETQQKMHLLARQLCTTWAGIVQKTGDFPLSHQLNSRRVAPSVVRVRALRRAQIRCFAGSSITTDHLLPLSELTWRLPSTDDEEEAAWLEAFLGKRRKGPRRKDGLSEAAGLDSAFIQQHLLHHRGLRPAGLNGPIDSRDTYRKTGLFFMCKSINFKRYRAVYVSTFTSWSMTRLRDCALG